MRCRGACSLVRLTLRVKLCGRGPSAEADAARRLPPLRLMRCGRRAAVKLVACKGSFGTSDAVLHVDVAPTNRTWLVVVPSDVGHQLAA